MLALSKANKFSTTGDKQEIYLPNCVFWTTYFYKNFIVFIYLYMFVRLLP